MPNSKFDYQPYSHNNPDVATLGSFVSDPNSQGIGLDIQKLLNYEDEDGRINLDNLKDKYSADQLTKFKTLLDQVKTTTLKDQVDNTAEVASSSGPISVLITPQPDSFIKIKDAIGLDNAINSLQQSAFSNIQQTLTPNQVDFLSNLSDKAKQAFVTFCLRVRQETLYEVVISDGLRNHIDQERIRKKNPKAAKSLSQHELGLAIDIKLQLQVGGTPATEVGEILASDKNGNYTDAEITTITALWKNTGVIVIARDMKMTWGGEDFGKGKSFDPIHFDLRNFYSVNTEEYLKAVQSPLNIPATADNNIPSSISSDDTENSNSKFADLPLNLGTVLNLPLALLDRDFIETNQAIKGIDFNSFLAKELLALMRDPGYERSFIPKKIKTKGQVKEIFPYMSVWVWSRALSILDLNGVDNNFKHTILNITPYITSLNTAVGKNGGAFSIGLAPITAELVASSETRGNKRWQVDRKTQKAAHSQSGDYVNQAFFHFEQDGDLKRSRFFFDKALQQNDIIFIRFERLVLEDKNRQNLDSLETIAIKDLPNQIFDMIGLVDSSVTTTTPANANVDVSVTGRDLIKLIIEDGVYFYPFDFTDGGIFANETGAANRRLVRFNGKILSRFQTLNKTIEKSLQYILNSLGSIDICPTSLFDGYKNGKDRITQQNVDKRSKYFELDNSTLFLSQEQRQQLDDQKTEVLDKIIQLRKNNTIVASSEIEVFNIIRSFLEQKINDNQIIEKASTQEIESLTETVNNVAVITNTLPDDLEESLFIKNRAWVDAHGRFAQNFTNITEAIEAIYKKVDKIDIQNHNVQIFSQLSKTFEKIEGSLTSPLHSNSVKDLIAEMQADIDDNSIKIDDIATDNSLFDSNDIQTLSSNYQAVVDSGNTISLVVLEKTFADLSKNEKDVFNSIYKIIKQEKDFLRTQNPADRQLPLNGIWQIIKLIIDDSVKNRLLADASIGNEHGSLLNAIRKICQEPFVEFFTDTYGDQFYFIVRKPPFDKVSVQSMLENKTVSEPNDIKLQSSVDLKLVPTPFINAGDLNNNSIPASNTKTTQVSLILDIDESDVLLDTLTYSTEAYSWYRLQLRNLISGNDANMAFAYLKAVYFNEFADVFGSKPLDVTTNYIPYQTIVDKNASLSTAYFIQQGTYDLKYLIESHAYLPFTRQGTITINGDRRYKKGTFVRLKSTNEIFYVDGVNNSFSIDDKIIDRTTTLVVSRGMVERYIKGTNPGQENNISYFNICNLPIDEKVFTDQKSGVSDFNRLILAKWKVNPIVFNFFLKKLQFAKDKGETIVLT